MSRNGRMTMAARSTRIERISSVSDGVSAGDVAARRLMEASVLFRGVSGVTEGDPSGPSYVTTWKASWRTRAVLRRKGGVLEFELVEGLLLRTMTMVTIDVGYANDVATDDVEDLIASMAILLRADRPVDAAYESMTKDVASVLAAHHYGLPAESMTFASANPYAPATLTHQTSSSVHQEASLGRDLARIAASTPMAMRAVVQFGRRGTTAALRTRYARAETRSALEILRMTERLAGRITT